MRTSSGPKSVRQRLNRFAFSAILAGVGFLALAWPAEAQIVYTPVNVTLGPNASYSLDLNNDGITDFTISTVYSVTRGGPRCPSYFASVDETPTSGNGAEGAPPRALKGGDQIGPSQTYYAGQGTLKSDTATYTKGEPCTKLQNVFYGKWSRHLRYLGLALQINGETYYGWAELEVKVNYLTASATLTGYAYESTPGMPINAGQTQ